MVMFLLINIVMKHLRWASNWIYCLAVIKRETDINMNILTYHVLSMSHISTLDTSIMITL